jgi:restriction endonuclease
MFRRGRRHEAPTERSSKGVEEQPFWLAGQVEGPERVRVAPMVTLLREDAPPWLAEQQLWQWHRSRGHLTSALPGVSTQEVLEALGASFSPVELDWELVGVTFVHAIEVEPEPEPAGDLVMVEEAPAEAPELAPPARRLRVVHGLGAAVARKRRRKWLREHDQIMAVVRELSWEGYLSLVADIFRREGYEVFTGEGPDGDVIDMEVVKGAERMVVNCQLRGLGQIDTAPLAEMAEVAKRNGADGAFVISDGDFAPESWSFADEEALVLIDRDALLGLVLDFTMGIKRDKRLRGRLARLARLFSSAQPGTGQRAS